MGTDEETTRSSDEVTPAEEPWVTIGREIEAENVQGLVETLDALPSSDTVRAVSRLSQAEQDRLLQMLTPEGAAEVIEEVPEAQAAEMIEHLPTEDAAAIVRAMSSDDAADVLGDVSAETSEAILSQFTEEAEADARELLSYDDDSAGGLMVTEYLAFAQDLRVADVRTDLQGKAEQYADYDVQYTYVVDENGILTGVLRLRDLVLAPGQRLLSQMMLRDPVSVFAEETTQALHDFFEDHAYVGVPVVDGGGKLLGVVHKDAVSRMESRHAEETYLQSTGIVGGEELRSMSLWRRSSRRLSWLSVNILLNVVAASVIAVYQETLAAVIVLAVFLPIISDMSGCSGNQSVAVSIRELTIGVIRPRDIFRVFWKEGIVGVLNGAVLGLLLGSIVWFWQGNLYLALVVGSALTVNTLVAVLLGGAVPLLLRGLKQDPALASGPILTTVTDMCGFFLVLSLASAFLAHLTAGP